MKRSNCASVGSPLLREAEEDAAIAEDVARPGSTRRHSTTGVISTVG
jgi:hypothetical protein